MKSVHHYPSGQILSEVNYENGFKQGTAKVYSEEGKLLSEREFARGLEVGVHRFFYPNGQLKTAIPYLKGLLNGEVLLYYPEGMLKRSSHYRLGKREGKDTLYAVNGSPLLEAEYQDDKPIGKAITWYLDGSVAKEIYYFTPGVIARIKRWDADGNLIPEAEKDYIDAAVLNSLKLKNSIAGMTRGIEGLMNTLEDDFNKQIKTELHDEISAITKEMGQLQNLSDQLLQSSGAAGREKEAIWKTPSNEQQLYAFLQGITSPMQESMLKLQWQLRAMIEDLEKNKSDE